MYYLEIKCILYGTYGRVKGGGKVQKWSFTSAFIHIPKKKAYLHKISIYCTKVNPLLVLTVPSISVNPDFLGALWPKSGCLSQVFFWGIFWTKWCKPCQPVIIAQPQQSQVKLYDKSRVNPPRNSWDTDNSILRLKIEKHGQGLLRKLAALKIWL